MQNALKSIHQNNLKRVKGVSNSLRSFLRYQANRKNFVTNKILYTVYLKSMPLIKGVIPFIILGAKVF